MKRFVIVFVLLFLTGCGGSFDWSYNGADKCTGGEAMLVSNLTPTRISLVHNSGMATFNVAMNISGTACQNGTAHMDMNVAGARVSSTATFPSAADAYSLRINNIMFDTTGLPVSQGTFSFYITTTTRTSNVVAGSILIQ